MDRATQMREIRKMGAAPDIQINSVAALTQDGRMVVASSTGSQIGPIAFGAGRLILVVGSQKIVKDLDTAMRRVTEYCLPIEDAKMQKLYGVRSAVNKMLVFNAEASPGRTTVIIVREPVGT
jgi:acyl-CoA hydrolase